MSRKSYSIGMAGSLAAAAFIVAVPSAQALSFKISGQVNRAIIGATNGKSAGVGFVDNHSSDSRFGFSGSQKVDPNLSVGFQWVEGLGANQSSHFDIHNSAGGPGLQNRQANVYIKGPYGKLTLGKTDGAANSTSKVDLSGTTDLGGGTPVHDYFGNITMLNGNGKSAVKIKQVYNSYDALSRVNTIRYDSPSYKGLKLAASFDQGRAVEISPKYKHQFNNGVKVAAALDYVNSGQRNKDVRPNGHYKNNFNSNAQFNEYGGSASMLLPNGLNFTVQYKRRSYSNTYYQSTGSYYPSKGIYTANKENHSQTFFGGVGYIYGKNHVQLFYGQTDNAYNSSSVSRNYGVAYVYDLMKSVNMYAAYHHVSANHLHIANGVKNVNILFTGFRIKFF